MKLSVSLLLLAGSASASNLRSMQELPAPAEDSFEEPMLVACPDAAIRKPPAGENPCEGTNPQLPKVECYIDAIEQTKSDRAQPQSGALCQETPA